MVARLEEAMQANGGLQKHQYGFRKRVGTTDAIKSIVGELQEGSPLQAWD